MDMDQQEEEEVAASMDEQIEDDGKMDDKKSESEFKEEAVSEQDQKDGADSGIEDNVSIEVAEEQLTEHKSIDIIDDAEEELLSEQEKDKGLSKRDDKSVDEDLVYNDS